MRRLSFITAALFVSMVSFAGKVTEKQALQKAQHFMQSKQFKHRNLRRAPSIRSNAYYVFNAEGNDGFVIVSGDDRTTPILGYANNGNLDMENLPDNLKWWLESYAAQIAALGDEQEAAAPTVLGPAIEPLVQSKWAQDLPYNSMCPDGNYIDYDEAGFDRYDRCVVGCVPVAMAQVMYYWKWPESCPAVDSYEVTEGKTLKGLPATTFRWDDMTDFYSYLSSDESVHAVAELMRYCGQAVHIVYGTGVTSGYANPSAIIKTFGYSKNTHELERDDYTTSQWETIVYHELAAQRPLLYSGASETGGHQFIIDGYDGHGLFHINWGWNGIPDSYYVLSVADAGTNQGIGGSSGAYYFGQKALFNMQPGEDGEVLRPLMRMVGSHMYPPEVNNTYTRTDATTDFSDVFISLGISVNYAMEPDSEMNVELGWALYQADELKLLVGSRNYTIPATQYNTISNEMTASFGAGLAEGKYLLSPVFRFSEDAEWERCEGYGVHSVLVEVTPTTLTMRVPDKNNMSFVVNSMSISDYPEAGSPISLSANITNNGETKRLTAVLWIQKQDETTWKQCGKTTGYTDLGTTIDVSLNFLQEEAGSYRLKLTTGNSEEALATATIEIAASEEVVVEGLKYRCTPAYKRAKVIKNYEGDMYAESVNIQQTVKSGDGTDCRVVAIGDAAFYGWGMTSLTIPEGVETIGYNAFEACNKITQIVLPSTVTSIGYNAFYNTGDLSVLISHIQDPFEIGEEMFMYQYFDMATEWKSILPSAATLYVPVGTKYKYEALAGWNQFGDIKEGELQEAVVDGIRYAYATGETTASVIHDDSYQELTAVTIPAEVVINGKTFSVTAIGHSAFKYSGNITSISLPEGLETIGDYAFVMGGFTEIKLPSTLQKIGKEAFWNCCMETMIIPEGVQTIGDFAFANMYNLTQLDLPNSLTKTGYKLIFGCNQLKSVNSYITDPYAISSSTFISELNFVTETNTWVITPSPATLYVPHGTKEKYEALSGWTTFANIKERPSEEETSIQSIRVPAENEKILDLSGRQMKALGKGVYITNGKKILVK
ncbi:MAG: C10 family peptidase [Bacteroidaceae bacterium]|nr:C10 family peptidase [Bacteroidaceae bacterium]